MGAVRRRASGLWRTGGQERASTAHDHKTITFTHFDGLALFLTTHTINRLSMATKIVPQARHAGLAQLLALCRGSIRHQVATCDSSCTLVSTELRSPPVPTMGPHDT